MAYILPEFLRPRGSQDPTTPNNESDLLINLATGLARERGSRRRNLPPLPNAVDSSLYLTIAEESRCATPDDPKHPGYARTWWRACESCTCSLATSTRSSPQIQARKTWATRAAGAAGAAGRPAHPRKSRARAPHARAAPDAAHPTHHPPRHPYQRPRRPLRALASTLGGVHHAKA